MPVRDLTIHGLATSTSAEEAALRFWVVPHTHWDREWYLPFEQLRVRLGEVVDEIIESLERDPSLSFSLDGQVILLEDYLEVRPDQEGRLRKLLSSGRLAVGPSYILPDEFLVGQESLVRNLLIGRDVCARFGAPPMPAAYAPDTFGHVAQMPQILRGFGIDAFLFWRGLGDEAERLGAVFNWRGHDASEVLAVRLLGGYSAHKNLGRWTRTGGPVEDPARWAETAPIQILEHVERFRDQLSRPNLTDILICNGDDHEPMQPDLDAMVAACRERLPGASFQVATFPEYVDALRWRLGAVDQQAGELLGGYEACVVRGVNSTRIYLKQANEATEAALLSAEALAALASMRTGARYPLAELRLAWRELLKNHPHDSLPGCSLDEVHRDMEQRFRSASQIATEVSREALRQLAGTPRPARPWMEDPSERSVVNPLPWRRPRLVEIALPEARRYPGVLVVETAAGALPLQVEGSGAKRRGLVALELPGFGSRSLRVMSGSAPSVGNANSTADGAIENEFYRVRAAANGTISVTDLATGRTYDEMHWFQDEADRGDEYSFCPVKGDASWDSRGLVARTRVVSSGPWVAEMEISLNFRLPKGLRPGRRARKKTIVSCPIRTRVRLVSGVDRVEFQTAVDNRAKEHRLRVLFRAPESRNEVRAESAFAMIRRPARPAWNGRWREPPADTNHTGGVVSAGLLSLMTRGLPEYEAVPRSEGGVDLALTLLRCVGFLSWGDLETRVGALEPHIPTPDAQCQGRHLFEYAISLRGEASDPELLRASRDYRTDFAIGPRGGDFDGLMRLDGNGYAFSALKGAEDGHGVILRLYNPGAEVAEARLLGDSVSFRRCQMDETGTEVEAVRELHLHPGEIVTLRVEGDAT